MWKLCIVLFVYFVQSWGGGQTIIWDFINRIDCCLQSRQLYNVCVGGTNKSETEINGKKNKIRTVERLWERVRPLVRAERSQRKVKRLSVSKSGQERDNADGDGDQSRKIRRWYRLEVKIALIWNNITFKKEPTVPSKGLHNLLRVISTEKVFCPEIITITAPTGSVIAPRWHCRLLNCHGAPCFGRAHTWTGCPQDWLTVYLLHLFDIFTTYRINTT